VQVLGMLKGHPNVVQLEGVFEDETAVHIVMELCTGGCLTEHISSQVPAPTLTGRGLYLPQRPLLST